MCVCVCVWGGGGRGGKVEGACEGECVRGVNDLHVCPCAHTHTHCTHTHCTHTHCTHTHTLTHSQLINEQTTLFLYLLLQGNSSVASFILSRSDIDLLVSPPPPPPPPSPLTTSSSLTLSLSPLLTSPFSFPLSLLPPLTLLVYRFTSTAGVATAKAATRLWQREFTPCVHVAHHLVNLQPG